LITSDLFEEVLIKPVLAGADTLRVLSGYATPAMALRHIESLNNLEKFVCVELIVGMPVVDGISLTNHKGFQDLSAKDFFQCSYIYRPPAVHSKVYVWLKDQKPLAAFAGSANYTQNAFGKQREVLAPCDPNLCDTYITNIAAESIYCNHNDADQLVQIYNDKLLTRRLGLPHVPPEAAEALQTASGQADLTALPQVCISFLANDGTLPQSSGLNWGQRDGREPNQAYIKLPSVVYHVDFFPQRPARFTVLTDDNKTLHCARAQDHGKAIHTPDDNSVMGKYFRQRLAVDLGEAVQKEDLDRYGRSDVCFWKIDDETYFMDFSNAY